MARLNLSDLIPSRADVVSSTKETINKFGGTLVDAGKEVLKEKLGPLGGILDASEGRLSSAGLSKGAGLVGGLTPLTPSTSASTDTRVKLIAPSGSTARSMIEQSQLLRPLATTGYSVIFPFQPNISVIYSAMYAMEQPTHSNFQIPNYQGSAVQQIIIPGEFSASNVSEATYVLAAMHFLRTCTRMFYGQDDNAGTPPPILRLNGHGRYMFDQTPVAITDFNFVLPDDVDYIPVTTATANAVAPLLQSNDVTMIPTSMIMNVTLQPLYSRKRISEEFSLKDFASGKLTSGGGRGGIL